MREAFPALKDTPDDAIAIAAKLPGMQAAVQIMPSLWPQIWSRVSEVVVSIPPTEDDKRFKLVTEVATSVVHLRTPDNEHFELRINLNVANLQDLKRLIEQKTGVAVERQIVVFRKRVYGTKGVIEAGAEVRGDDVLIDCDVKLGHPLELKLKSKEDTSQSWPATKEAYELTTSDLHVWASV
ncbi:unnamed protein product [Peniophora sp. CBMAI 1063]|nr:unnamed protein product [Peniophora sp. CBMAI 1063]